MQEDKKLKVITYHGQVHDVIYVPDMTTGELKYTILQVDKTVPDFDFMYAGKIIRANDKLLGEFIKDDNLSIYTNAKGVHGGCCKF